MYTNGMGLRFKHVLCGGPLPNGRGSEAASFWGICVSMPQIPNRDGKEDRPLPYGRLGSTVLS